MRKLTIVLSFLIITFVASAQVITYDTIRVSPNDSRNINRNAQRSDNVKQTTNAKRPIQPKSNTNAIGLDKSKMRYGANIGLSLSRNYSSINIGPQIGYQASPYFMFGLGVQYNYNKVRGYRYNNSTLYKNNLIGANAFGYFYPMRFITIFAQPEINYFWSNVIDENTGDISRSNGPAPSMLVGAGLRLGRSHITVNYDLVQHTNSPYSDNVFLGISVFF